MSEKDEMQTKLIKSESKVITLETDMKELKSDFENKITILESTIAAKDNHIKQLVDFSHVVECEMKIYGTTLHFVSFLPVPVPCVS